EQPSTFIFEIEAGQQKLFLAIDVMRALSRLTFLQTDYSDLQIIFATVPRCDWLGISLFQIKAPNIVFVININRLVPLLPACNTVRACKTWHIVVFIGKRNS